jgi:hypothetical protein
MTKSAKHDFRGIATQGRVEPDKKQESPEQWTTWNNGHSHLLYPTNEAALFKVRVEVSVIGNCHLVVSPKHLSTSEWLSGELALGQGSSMLESNFTVEGFSTMIEIAELRRKAKRIAQNLLKRQAALL